MMRHVERIEEMSRQPHGNDSSAILEAARRHPVSDQSHE
jgi:hypothetical protein